MPQETLSTLPLSEIEQNRYTKLLNKLNNAFRQSDVQIATPNGHSDLSPAQYDRQPDNRLQAEISVGLSKSLSRKTLSADGVEVVKKAIEFVGAILDPQVIQAMMPGDAIDITRMAVSFAQNPDQVQNLTIKTGLGGSDDPRVSLRVAAYAFPASKLGQNLADVSGRQPKLHFFSAYNAGIDINGKDPQLSKSNAETHLHIIHQFIAHTNPQALTNTFFSYDSPLANLPNNVQVLRAHLESILANPQDEMTISALDDLIKKRAGNHANGDERQAAIAYAALHALIFGDISTQSTSLLQISIGSRAEKLFNAIRQMAIKGSEHMGLFKPEANAMLIGKVGTELPPYYFMQNIEDALTLSSENLANLPNAMDVLKQLRLEAENEPSLTGTNRKIVLKRIDSVIREWQMVVNVLGSPEQLNSFANSL